MRKYIAKRIGLMILLLIGVSFIVFASLYLSPGDPAELVAGASATPADIARMRIFLGLDKPFLVQYFIYFKNLLVGNFGTSLVTRQPILKELLVRLPNTLNLATSSMIVACVFGIPAGILAAIYKDTWIDNVLTTTSLAGISIPNFWLGAMLILLFSVTLRWLPTGGMSQPFWTPIGFKQAILPSLALGFSVAASFMRVGRSAMLDVLQSDYIRTARSKGLKESTVIIVHALRNALIPIITIFGTSFGGLLGGAIVTEQVFVVNGIGTYLISSISMRNYPAVQSTVLVIAAFFIIVNLIVDVIYVFIDPRISYE